MGESNDRPRKGKERQDYWERVDAWKELLEAERMREGIVANPEDKWSANFTTRKEEIMKSLDERIHALRQKLGLAPPGEADV